MPDTLRTLLILCPMVFLAGFVDSIAGGGGLISLPAYLLCGFPAHVAYGTNKTSSVFGTFFATLRYWRSGSLDIQVGLVSGVVALIGSSIGARLALALSDRFLRIMLLVLLPIVAVTTVLRRKGKKAEHTIVLTRKKTFIIAASFCFLIGAYDGFFGPGTGTFLILAFTGLLGFDYAKAGGTAKVVNLSSNFAAVCLFAFSGKVALWAAIPAALCSIAGNWIGSGMAIKRGAKFIRLVMLGVLVLLFARLLWDFIQL